MEDSMMSLFKSSNNKKKPSHEGNGLTTQEVAAKLGVSKVTALARIKKLVNDNKLKPRIVNGFDLCGRPCRYVVYEPIKGSK